MKNSSSLHIFIQQIKFPDIVDKHIQQTFPSLPKMIWNPSPSFTVACDQASLKGRSTAWSQITMTTAIHAKMTDRKQLFLNCFADILSLLNFCDEDQNSISRPSLKSVIKELESAGKFVENILPFVSEDKDELTRWLTEAESNLS